MRGRLFVLLLAVALFHYGACEDYMIGRGIADITGMASEGVLYGYANPDQDARGLHTRQYVRTFIVSQDDVSVVLVIAEISLVSQALKMEVIEKLSEIFGDLYTDQNLLISATHSHSTPGGHNTYWMYQVPSGGFVQPTFDAYVQGIVKSVQLAHDDLQPASILMTSDDLLDTTINRSPYSYDQNPEEEKARYEHNVDKTMTVLKIVGEDDDMGMLNFFPVHTTSIKNFNKLVSHDNKGIASQLWERRYNPGARPGQASVLGAFVQTAEGDVTPNTAGDLCDVTFEACSYNRSTCPENPNNPTLCNSYGPTGDMFVDCEIAGINQFNKAVELYDEADEEVSGPVDFRHTWVNITDVYVGDDEFGNPLTTCRPAMGFSFAAGATDGPGVTPFTQGDLEGIPAVESVIDRVFGRSEEMKACHHPKPVLLPTGEIMAPYPWQPEIIPLQLLRIGQLVFIGCAAEITTMSGRRLQDTVKQAFEENGVEDIIPIVLALSNGFTSYVTTIEEYSIQRYEGASTSYGPHTLEAYQLIFRDLATAMATGEDVDEGPDPLDLRGFPGDALPNLRDDLLPDGMDYGDVYEQPDGIYSQGEEASAMFVAGNPRNNLRHDDTFLEIQRLDEDEEEWVPVFYDADYETKFYWDSSCHDVPRPNIPCNNRQYSNATIVWQIPEDQEPATYRIVHYGAAFTGSEVVEYSGMSESFEVVEALNKKSSRLQKSFAPWEHQTKHHGVSYF